MMNIDMIWINYLLLASNALLAGCAALAIIRAQRLTQNQESFWKSTTGAALTMQPGQEELLKAIDSRITELGSQLESPRHEVENDSQATSGVPFENAVRMAKHGATMDDLTRTCGLSASEARLLMRVHGQHAQMAQAS
jgi:hypothetical protein